MRTMPVSRNIIHKAYFDTKIRSLLLRIYDETCEGLPEAIRVQVAAGLCGMITSGQSNPNRLRKFAEYKAQTSGEPGLPQKDHHRRRKPVPC
jgi:hypothetical protein